MDIHTVSGSEVSGNAVTIAASRNLTVTASSLQSTQTMNLSAGQDVFIQAGAATQSSTHVSESHKGPSPLGRLIGAENLLAGGDPTFSAVLLTDKSRRQNAMADVSQAVGSTVSAGSLTIGSGRDTRISGSTVVTDGGLNIDAGRDLSIVAAQSTRREQSNEQSATSGFVGSVWQPAIGKVDQSDAKTGTAVIPSASEVASLGGDIHLTAGGQYQQTGSKVMAQIGDIAITGKAVTIDAAAQTQSSDETRHYDKTAVGGSINIPLVDAAMNIYNVTKTAGESNDPRLKMLAAANAAMSAQTGLEAYQTLSRGNLAGIKIGVNLSNSKQESAATTNSSTAQGSEVLAGGSIAIAAMGAGQDSNVKVVGSDIRANQDIELAADNRIDLAAAESTYSQHSSNSSSGASVGVAFNIGQQNGFSLELAAGRAMGNADGDAGTWNNTHVDAGGTLTLQSGGDTALTGAVASGRQVVASIGGDLAIASPQDTLHFDAQQDNSGFSLSLCVPPFCYGTSSGSASMSGANATGSYATGSYASVGEQSAIRAGDGGFQIDVKGATTLTGAVVGSTDQAVADGKNSLTTGTLAVADLSNTMSGNAQNSGITLSTSMLDGKYAAAKGVVGNLLNQGSASVSDDSVSHGAIAGGAVTITDESAQQTLTGMTGAQTVANLDRTTTDTSRTLASPDMTALQQSARQQQAYNQLVFDTAVKFTDESYRRMFLNQANLYRISKDEDNNTVIIKVGDEEKYHLQPGPDGKVHVANNGIFNTLEEGANNALQNAAGYGGPQYLIYFPKANNPGSELLIAGYQFFLEGGTLGLTNATQQNVDLANTYGSSGLQIDGHSRGGMTTGNALDYLASQPGSTGSLPGTSINLYGSAYNAQDAANQLGGLSGGKGGVYSEVNANDFVGTIIGRNNPTGGVTPPGSSTPAQWLNVIFGTNTAHNCYGGGRPGCEGFWGKTIPTPVLIPPTIPGGSTNGP